MAEKNYDSTIMRIAGNLLSGSRPEIAEYIVLDPGDEMLSERELRRVQWAVAMGREIVAETLRSAPSTEPK
jgi:hypothetical protein